MLPNAVTKTLSVSFLKHLYFFSPNWDPSWLDNWFSPPPPYPHNLQEVDSERVIAPKSPWGKLPWQRWDSNLVLPDPAITQHQFWTIYSGFCCVSIFSAKKSRIFWPLKPSTAWVSNTKRTASTCIFIPGKIHRGDSIAGTWSNPFLLV